MNADISGETMQGVITDDITHTTGTIDIQDMAGIITGIHGDLTGILAVTAVIEVMATIEAGIIIRSRPTACTMISRLIIH